MTMCVLNIVKGMILNMIKVVATLIEKDNKVLIARCSEGYPNVFDKWEFPG